MNPLFLLLGLLGAGALQFSSAGGSSSGSSKGRVTDTSDKDESQDGEHASKDKDNSDDDGTKDDGIVVGDDTVAGGDDGGGTGSDDDDNDDGGMGSGGDDTMAGGDDTMAGGDDHGDHGGGTGSDDDDNDDGGMGSGGDDHGGHDTPPEVTPPGVGASQSQIDAYVDALADLPEIHVHDSSSSKAGEHSAAMGLVERGDATHVAIGDGDWFNPDIWSNGEVPGDDARVLIPDGVTVNYGGVSDARLFTVRIDGTLDFATDANSQMIFDTVVASPTGHLIMGTADDPVQANVDIDLIVADNGRIDTNWDPFLLSRGMVLHGKTTIHGAEKDSHEKITEDPMEGDTSIKFAGVPEGWQVGDTIVIAGTHYDGYKWDNAIDGKRLYPPEDEERVITQIDDDGRIHFEGALEHNHDTPRDDLFTSVANYTRNISVESENADDLDVFERGHVMFMHSDDVDVRYAEFRELGRTDKSEDSRDLSNIDNVSFDSNVQGRYSLHLHKTGTSDLDNPAILEGNAVYGSPGWGIVHHDSNAVITNNATYDTFGAGYVAETGNETGVWVDNIAIWAEGQSWAEPKNSSEIGPNVFDTGRGGDGFWFQGRMVASVDNVAASVNTGFAYFHRNGDQRMIDFDSSLFDYGDALYGNDDVTADDVPILGFRDNEAFAAREGLHVVKAGPNQGHDVWSQLDGFTAWSVKSGAHLEYTSHYILRDFDLIGKESTRFSDAESGISFGSNTTETVVVDARVDGFEIGIDLNKSFTRSEWNQSMNDYVVINADITNADQDYANYNSSLDRILDHSDLPNRAADLNLDTLTYAHSSTYSQSVVSIEGTKTDTLGTLDFPGGTDAFEIGRDEVIKILEDKGYWSTSDGQDYFLVDIYMTDRVTGEIFYETHPVFIQGRTLDGGLYSDAQFNGTQNITSQGGDQFAGDTLLNTPVPATPTGGSSIVHSTLINGSVPESALASEASMTSASHAGMESQDSVVSEIWMNGYEGADTLELTMESGLFVNVGDMSNVDASVSGGNMVLAAGGGAFHLDDGRSLAVFDAAAKVGFDGDDDDELAILDLEEGSTVSFSAGDDSISTIEEFSSGAYGDTPEVASGIDLGSSTLAIDLAGLTAEDGAIFELMDADEIAGVFNEAIVGGLGARNAKIVVDYETDRVSLELSAGDGTVELETLGQESDVTSGQEDIWAALTNGQGVFAEDTLTADDDEHDAMHEAA